MHYTTADVMVYEIDGHVISERIRWDGHDYVLSISGEKVSEIIKKSNNYKFY